MTQNVTICQNQLCIFRQNSANVKLRQVVLTSEIKIYIYSPLLRNQDEVGGHSDQALGFQVQSA